MTEADAARVAEHVTQEIRQSRKRDGRFWLVMVLTAVVGNALAIAFSAYNTNQTELKFCALMDTSVSQAQDRLAGYIAAPPSTDAGRAQQANAAESVRLLTDLQRSLGCPIESRSN